LQILQGLSSEQRDAISQQLEEPGWEGSKHDRRSPAANERSATESHAAAAAELLMDSQKQRAEMQRLSPFLQGEDGVVITVDSNPLPVGNQAADRDTAGGHAGGARRC